MPPSGVWGPGKVTCTCKHELRCLQVTAPWDGRVRRARLHGRKFCQVDADLGVGGRGKAEITHSHT